MQVDSKLASIREYVADFVGRWPLEKNAVLQSAWVHGDYHGRNMVFVGDDMRGLFDFDAIHHGFKVEDISYAIYAFGREYRGSHVIRTDIARLFLEEYTRHTRLQPEDLQALPVFGVINQIPSGAYFNMLKRDGEDTIAYLLKFVTAMCAVHSEMKRLEPIFREFSR